MCKYFADFLAFLGDLSDFEFIFDPLSIENTELLKSPINRL